MAIPTYSMAEVHAAAELARAEGRHDVARYLSGLAGLGEASSIDTAQARDDARYALYAAQIKLIDILSEAMAAVGRFQDGVWLGLRDEAVGAALAANAKVLAERALDLRRRIDLAFAPSLSDEQVVYEVRKLNEYVAAMLSEAKTIFEEATLSDWQLSWDEVIVALREALAKAVGILAETVGEILAAAGAGAAKGLGITPELLIGILAAGGVVLWLVAGAPGKSVLAREAA